MILVKVGRPEAVYRVVITTREGSSTHLVVAADAVNAGGRAAREAGLRGRRRNAIDGMEVEQLTGKGAPADAQRAPLSREPRRRRGRPARRGASLSG
jgi:hypothetical protein